jgi:6-phosphogluconolactonase
VTTHHVHATPADALEAMVRAVEAEAAAAIAARGAFALALTGGSLATDGFPHLAKAGVDWSRVDLLWGDERAVPPDHPDSNYRVAKELLLDPVGARPERVHRMPGERPDLQAAAREYDAVVRRVGLDLALLGAGPDGHVCSLFPGRPLLGETTAWAAAIEDSPKPPPRRLTLTLPALGAARMVLAVVLGAGKAACVKAALEEPASELPLALVLRAGNATLLVDRAAAGQR